MILSHEQATVYRANGRRYLSKRNAYMAIARAKVKAKVLEYWHKDDGDIYPMVLDETKKLIKRFARLLAHYDRVGGVR